MGLLSGLISTATNAVGTNENAHANAAKSNMAATIERAQITRQQQQDAIQQAIQAREAQSQALKDQLTGAQIKSTGAETVLRERQAQQPLAPVLGTPEYTRAEAALADARAAAEERHRQQPPDQVISSTDPNTGQVHVSFANPRTHQVTETGVLGKQPTAGGGSGGASGAQVPVADMEQRYNEIAQHAQDLAAGKWKMSSSMQTREGLNYSNAVDNAAGHPSITHQLLSGALNTVGAGGDDYTRYQALLNSTRALGDDVAKVFKGRQNEQAVMREVALAEITPDDYQNPTVVAQKLSRLKHVIDLAKLNNPSQAGLVTHAPHVRPSTSADPLDKYDLQ